MTIRAWLAAIIITLAVGWHATSADTHPASATAPEATADEEDAAALASRDWVASKVCNGQPFEWLDDKTLVCHKEQPSGSKRGPV